MIVSRCFSPPTATVTDTSGKLLCKNISVDAIMQMTADEVIATFGEPEIYIENESIEYGADAPEHRSSSDNQSRPKLDK